MALWNLLPSSGRNSHDWQALTSSPPLFSIRHAVARHCHTPHRPLKDLQLLLNVSKETQSLSQALSLPLLFFSCSTCHPPRITPWLSHKLTAGFPQTRTRCLHYRCRASKPCSPRSSATSSSRCPSFRGKRSGSVTAVVKSPWTCSVIALGTLRV